MKCREREEAIKNSTSAESVRSKKGRERETKLVIYFCCCWTFAIYKHDKEDGRQDKHDTILNSNILSFSLILLS
jgi:hypothetical protein